MSVPKLRFKEFQDAWENISFKALFSFKNGVNASKEQYGSGIKFINVLDIINNPNGIFYNEIIGSVEVSLKDTEKNIVNYGDIVFQRSPETREEVGQSSVYLSHEPVVFGGFVIRGHAQMNYVPQFMNSALKTDKVRDQITQLSGGSTRFNIGQDSLNKVFVDLPILAEQTKIASFLSAVDDKIAALRQEHDLWQQYKQGMMQQLFSQKLRFQDDNGQDFPDWEEKTLGEIVIINPKVKSLPNSFIYIDLESVEKGRLLLQKKLLLSDAPSRAQRYLQKNDILFQMVRPYQQNNYHFNLNGDYVASTGYAQIRTEQNAQYVYFALHEKSFLDEVINRCTGTSYPSINSTDLSAINISLPSLAEQTKIAACLSSIDAKINAVAQQLEQARVWKQGLLQQMFV